ncbi:MAG: YchJ family protein [Spirochaetaceae bacterium]|jgi:SEC-C motif-containing protein|nr:YchJ family protein [Spirochaetaceae bacterium]
MKPCPCGSGLAYAECCEPYITGARRPPTAEALMRSRYSAYAEHAVDYILNTCIRGGERDIDEKQTRAWSEKSTWLGLRILSVARGLEEDTEGSVEFEARYEQDGLQEIHHEQGRFKKQDGVWLYEDGTIVPHTVVRSAPKVGRNEPCPCGSGKKYKHCCGKSPRLEQAR